MLDVIRELGHGGIAARWSKVSKSGGRHTRRMHRTAVRRAKGILEMLLPRDRKENRKNEKCTHLGRSKTRTHTEQVRDSRENTQELQPIGHVAFSHNVIFNFPVVYGWRRVGLMAWPWFVEVGGVGTCTIMVETLF